MNTINLINGDCLDEMKKMEDKSIDVIFCDLPYGQTNCKWDTLIDLDGFWKEVMRIKKLHTPIIMTCTTKFGASLINSAPKKCPFRYDLIWCKSAAAGFLRAKKAPMRKHEMIYLFYEREPFYDISSHKHKFLGERETNQKNGEMYGRGNKKCIEGKYDPPLPTSLVKKDEPEPEVNEKYTYKQDKEKDLYGTDIRKETRTGKDVGKSPIYDPPLPTSLVKEDEPDLYGQTCNMKNEYEEGQGMNKKERKEVRYDPPLPHSLLEIKSTRGKHSTEKPVGLMEWILKYYSKVDDVIFDPTMGSGSMGVACKNMNRKFIGIEMDEEIFKVAEGRMKD